MLGIGAIAVVLCLRFFEVIGTYAAGGLIAAIIAIGVLRSAASYEPKQEGDQSLENDEGIAVRAHLKLAYRDADGVLSDREVMVSRYVSDGDGYIVAFCRLRKDSRTFRLDRIIEAVDLETGEVLPVSRMRSWLRKRRA
ncbi:WYL domain-containing protein [Pseudomonas sp. HY13-MNA-CIBAN-0226]|uniref:WYL domain-containing protein n=1 Tax=Pseudomonas sp. HY13-MNA-CIBAN-0226 TaxID=3140473 RepID=UPI00331A6AFD